MLGFPGVMLAFLRMFATVLKWLTDLVTGTIQAAINLGDPHKNQKRRDQRFRPEPPCLYNTARFNITSLDADQFYLRLFFLIIIV